MLCKTALGAAIRLKRGERSYPVTAREVGVTYPTLWRLEAGQHTPSPGTAQALAKWLGWTLDQVYAAASAEI
jgi:DNA-binding XRE family transcriptional regulator